MRKKKRFWAAAAVMTLAALILNGCASFLGRINRNAEILAEEEPPEYAVLSTDMAAHVQHELETLISLSNAHPEFNAWNLAYVQTIKETGDQAEYGRLQSAVGQIRFNQYFSMPLYAGLTVDAAMEDLVNAEDIENLEDLEGSAQLDLLLGSGLVFRHSIGTIGVLAGWRADMEGHRYGSGDSRNHELEQEMDWYFSVVPLINTGKFPVIGLLFSVYEGLIGNNGGTFGDNFSHKLVSRGIDLGAVSIKSIDVLYKKEPYNAAAKVEEYGVKINIDAGKMAVTAETGYRRFYDVRIENKMYEDSLYGIFDWTVWKFSRWDIGLRGRFDKRNSPIPAIGISTRLSILSFWGELTGLNESDTDYIPIAFGLRLFL